MIRNVINSLHIVLMIISTSDGVADNCPVGQKLFKLDNGTYECLHCLSNCPEGTLNTKNCTVNHNTVCQKCFKSGFVGEINTTCAECSTCSPGKFHFKNCSKFEDTNCIACSICEPGTFIEKECTKFGNTICKPCDIGTFSDAYNSSSCRKCSLCEGQHVLTCNQSRDTVCFDPERSPSAAIDAVLIIIDIIVHVIICLFIIWKLRQKRFHERNGMLSSNQEALTLMAEGIPETQHISKSSTLEELMPSVGALIIKVGGRIVLTNVVFRVGSRYVMTAYHTLAEYVKLEQISSTKFKLLADDAYVTFNSDLDDRHGECYKMSSDRYAYFNEQFDIFVFEIIPRNIGLLKTDMPKPITPGCVDVFQDTRQLYFIDFVLNVKRPKGFQADIIAMNTIQETNAFLIDQATFFKSKMSESMKDLYDKCTTDSKNTEGQWIFWKYEGSQTPGTPGFIRDVDGGFHLCCMNTAHFSKVYDALAKERNGFPESYFHFTGIKISAVYEDMKRKDERLAKEIFGL